MNLKNVLSFCCLIVLAGCNSTKESLFLSVPNLHNADSTYTMLKHYEEKYKKEDAVYINYDYMIDEFENGAWNWKYIYKYKYIILNPSKKNLTTLTIRVGSGEVKNVFVKLTYPDGKTKFWGRQHLTEEKDSEGNKTLKLIYPNVTKGTIVEEGFELSYNGIKSSPNLEKEVFIPRSEGFVENYTFTYAVPNYWKSQFKNIRPGFRFKPEERNDVESKKYYYKFTFQNVPSMKDEPYSPFFKDFGSYIQFRHTDLSIADNVYKGNSSWSDFIRPYNMYVSDGKSIFDLNVGGMAEKLTKDSKTDLEKIKNIVHFVQQTIEIAGDGKDRDYGDVLNDKKGNVYRITGLVQAMLAKLKITSDFMLVHSGNEGYFDSEYITASQFNLPALKVKTNGTEYLLFPYVKNLPFGYVPEVLQGQTALMIINQGFGTTKKGIELFWQIPNSNQQLNEFSENYDIQIADDGMISVTEEKTVTGLPAVSLRNTIQKLRDDERETFNKGLLTYSDGEVKIEEVSFENLKEYNDPLKIKLSYTIDNLVTITPDEVLFQTGGLFSPASLQKYKIETDERQNPIKIFGDETYIKKIVIKFPENWTLENKPEDFEFSNMFGSVIGKYELNPTKLTVVQNRTLKKNSELKERIKELIEINGSRSKLMIPTLIFSVK